MSSAVAELLTVSAVSIAWTVLTGAVAPQLLSMGAWWYRRPGLALTAWWSIFISAALTLVVAVISLITLLAVLRHDISSTALRVTIEVALVSTAGAFVATMSYTIGRTEHALGRSTSIRDDIDILLRAKSCHRDQGTGYELVTLETDTPIALCLPGRRPRIVLSEGLISNLSREELSAVIWHERGHLELHHNALLRLASILDHLIGWIPSTRALSRSVRLLTELAADEFACQRVGAQAVADAMEKLRVAERGGPLEVHD